MWAGMNIVDKSERSEEEAYEMQMEKSKVGQSLVFLGILIDTVWMTISFDAIQAKGTKLQLIRRVYISNASRV